ncbi:hypothetical protein Tco_0995581, partial [Tanacetum coccineum]
VYNLCVEAAVEDNNVVNGTFLINNVYASVLFDTIVDRSFVSYASIFKLDRKVETFRGILFLRDALLRYDGLFDSLSPKLYATAMVPIDSLLQRRYRTFQAEHLFLVYRSTPRRGMCTSSNNKMEP